MDYNLQKNQNAEQTYHSIRNSIVSAQHRLSTAVNSAMVTTYWEIGEQIFKACGENDRAEYGKKLLEYLSEQLIAEFGKGFDKSNLRKMRQFYCTFPIRDTLCPELSWSHYRVLMRINDEQARRFYMEECAKAAWSVRQLERQIIATSMKSNGDNEKKGGRRYLPYAFTEQGIAMLSAVLRSDVAIQVSINIMNAFVEMRRFIANNALLFERISNVELKQLEYQKKTDEKLEQIFEYIADHEESNQKVFFDGQIYDAFSLIVSLIQKAEKEITLTESSKSPTSNAQSIKWRVGTYLYQMGYKPHLINCEAVIRL